MTPDPEGRRPSDERELQMEIIRGYSAPVWRCHGGRALHRRRRLANGTLSDLTICGVYEWPRRWHEEPEGSWKECKACETWANP